jgi:hypothetical protein
MCGLQRSGRGAVVCERLDDSAELLFGELRV